MAGTLKIDQAQFRELEAFTKFGGDVDAVTARVIDKGRKTSVCSSSPRYHPMAVEEEVAVIFCGTKGLLSAVPADKIAEFEHLFLQLLNAKYKESVLDAIKAGQFTDDVTTKLTEAAGEIAARYPRPDYPNPLTQQPDGNTPRTERTHRLRGLVGKK